MNQGPKFAATAGLTAWVLMDTATATRNSPLNSDTFRQAVVTGHRPIPFRQRGAIPAIQPPGHPFAESVTAPAFGQNGKKRKTQLAAEYCQSR